MEDGAKRSGFCCFWQCRGKQILKSSAALPKSQILCLWLDLTAARCGATRCAQPTVDKLHWLPESLALRVCQLYRPGPDDGGVVLKMLVSEQEEETLGLGKASEQHCQKVMKIIGKKNSELTQI